MSQDRRKSFPLPRRGQVRGQQGGLRAPFWSRWRYSRTRATLSNERRLWSSVPWCWSSARAWHHCGVRWEAAGSTTNGRSSPLMLQQSLEQRIPPTSLVKYSFSRSRPSKRSGGLSWSRCLGALVYGLGGTEIHFIRPHYRWTRNSGGSYSYGANGQTPCPRRGP